MVNFDPTIQGLDPASVHKVTLAGGAVMPVAAFGTFHSDWAQDYMKDATVEAIRVGWRHIDTARAYENEEVVGEAIVLARRAGNRLFHMHFNDNHGSWDDDMIVGSVHSVCYLETLYWLDRCDYKGWLSMDQYPYREDAADAIGESILWLRHFDRLQQKYRQQIDKRFVNP